METRQKDLVVVESGKRLSECLLWRLQEEFYANAGLDAWAAVPFYPTSNVFFTEAYADLIIHFLRDLGDTLNPAEPVTILEMAAGTGTFGFYLIREIQRKQAYFKELRDIRIRYLMTDFADSIVDGWQQNEQLRALANNGLLDFAVYRPEEQSSLTLKSTGQDFEPGNNPVIAIASYFFDSIRQELFRVSDHQLLEGRLSFRHEAGTPVTPATLVKEEDFVPAESPAYPDETLNALLAFYSQNFENASILFPIGALRCIQNLLRLTGDNLLLLAADKGFSDLNYMQGHKDQIFIAHEGAFSFMVNFDALGRYFELRGGFALKDSGHSSILNILAAGVLKVDAQRLDGTRYCFEESITRKDRANALNLLRRFVHPERHEPVNLLRAAMGLIQAGNYDPFLFNECVEVIINGIGDSLLVTDYRNLLRILAEVRRNIFGADRLGVYPGLEQVYFKLRHYADCRDVAGEALKRCGPSIHALMHLGACHEEEGHPADAAAFYQQVLVMSPGFEPAQAGLQRLSGGKPG